uniref:UL7 n=1 Tax=Steinernema glaseri TaxID=37863 RepID=A0A1I7ZB35_9BILA
MSERGFKWDAPGCCTHSTSQPSDMCLLRRLFRRIRNRFAKPPTPRPIPAPPRIRHFRQRLRRFGSPPADEDHLIHLVEVMMSLPFVPDRFVPERFVPDLPSIPEDASI